MNPRLTCAALVAISIAASAIAQDSAIEKYVKSLRSTEQVKEAIRGHLSAECATGSCVNSTTTEICSLVGALDIRLGGAISTDDSKKVSRSDFAVTTRDLWTFKKIWSQCKPTTYQYWNYGSVLHVAYDPDPRTDAEVRQALGISKKSQASPRPNQTSKMPKNLDTNLTQCLMPKAQYGKYSSYDGGKSAASLLQDACSSQYLEWVEDCISRGDSKNSCVAKAAIIAQMAIKLFDK